MKYFVGALLALLLAVVLAAPDEEKYTTKYDNINVDEIMKNDRLRKNYVNCLTDNGPCTPDGEELKKVIPDALTNECSKCNEKQKAGAEKVIKYLMENKKEEFEQLEKKYDPSGTYRKKYQDRLAKL